jgi:hypothetical protein
MKIGFDLDKVFIDYPPLIPDGVIDRLYKKKRNGELFYRIPSRPEQMIRRFSHVPFFRPPIQKNIAFLKSISTKNNQLYLISSRFSFLETTTLALLQKYGFDKIFEGMYFNFENRQPHLFKNEILKKLKLDKYVDDDLYLLDYVARENKDTNFFWLNNGKIKQTISPRISAISELEGILK